MSTESKPPWLRDILQVVAGIDIFRLALFAPAANKLVLIMQGGDLIMSLGPERWFMMNLCLDVLQFSALAAYVYVKKRPRSA
jgi:hypothetical protein